MALLTVTLGTLASNPGHFGNPTPFGSPVMMKFERKPGKTADAFRSSSCHGTTFIGLGTVNTCVRNLDEKPRVRSRAEAVAKLLGS